MCPQHSSKQTGNPSIPLLEGCDASPVGVVRFRRDGLGIVSCNEQAWRIVGIGAADAYLRSSVSQSVDRLVPLADQSTFHALLDAGDVGQPPAEFDARIRRADGTPVEIACWLSLVPDRTAQEGEVYQLVMVDVTRKRDAARTKSRARRAKELALTYDVVFLIEPDEQRARCLKFSHDEGMARFGSLGISLPDAAVYLVDHLAAPAGRDALRTFIEDACRTRDSRGPSSDGPRRIIFTGGGNAGRLGPAIREVVLLDAEGGGFFLCSRSVSRDAAPDGAEAQQAVRRNASPESTSDGLGLVRAEMPRVEIRTFGYFDVFVDGRPIAFRSEKAKELLALLVDRRGGFVTSSDIITALWENEPVSGPMRTRCRKVALRLNRTLEANGAGHIVESVRGRRRIVPELVSCDLFDYLSGEPCLGASFRGSYLKNYSWAESTLGELVQSSYRG